MKKLMSILLAVSMLVALGMTAFAEEEPVDLRKAAAEKMLEFAQTRKSLLGLEDREYGELTAVAYPEGVYSAYSSHNNEQRTIKEINEKPDDFLAALYEDEKLIAECYVGVLSDGKTLCYGHSGVDLDKQLEQIELIKEKYNVDDEDITLISTSEVNFAAINQKGNRLYYVGKVVYQNQPLSWLFEIYDEIPEPSINDRFTLRDIYKHSADLGDARNRNYRGVRPWESYQDLLTRLKTKLLTPSKPVWFMPTVIVGIIIVVGFAVIVFVKRVQRKKKSE